jgi:hypothetical protein
MCLAGMPEGGLRCYRPGYVSFCSTWRNAFANIVQGVAIDSRASVGVAVDHLRSSLRLRMRMRLSLRFGAQCREVPPYVVGLIGDWINEVCVLDGRLQCLDNMPARRSQLVYHLVAITAKPPETFRLLWCTIIADSR